MPLANTASSYGSVTKAFHWSIALLILALIPLGIVANGLPADTSEQIARKAVLFSFHKTLGVSVFFLAIARIIWAITQPKPRHLHQERRGEAFLARLAHWLLYASLVLVPLSGWLHHAATEGFAPIWWPFGQSLPFVPKDADLAHDLAALHLIFERVLVVTLLLHVAGALKHHFWDRDATLLRMLPGHAEADGSAASASDQPEAGHWQAPLAATAVFTGAIGIGAALGAFSHAPAIAAEQPLETVAESNWQVTEGELAITIRQLGSEVTGSFADWTAAIDFNETPTNGKHGSVEVIVAIPSISLGSVTAQAMGPDYFDVEAHPTATFSADLLAAQDGAGYIADGTLSLKGASVPLSFPFDLAIDGEVATARLSASVDRRDFGIGLGQTDEGTLGFGVAIEGELTATRAAPES